MSKTEKEKTIMIDDVEYNWEELSEESRNCVNHIQDLDRKINNSAFNYKQLVRNRQAFMSDLKESLPNANEERPSS